MVDKLTLKGSKDKWLPANLNSLENYLSVLLQENSHFTKPQITWLRKNIAYNLQSIEFLYRISKDINLTSVLLTQNIKLFIICGTSIIEGLFYYLVVTNGKKAKIWKSYKKIPTNPYTDGENTFMLETEIFIEVSPLTSMTITFDQMCKTVEKHKLLGDVENLYKRLAYIRKLRNKIHIQDIKHSTDTDWYTFNEKEFKLMKNTLYVLLTSSLFSNSSPNSLFDYLR
jgi:hypothetical protein